MVINMICAIHQPNFFPWLGYFNKISRADFFVFLDEVPYPKSGSSMRGWSKRVKIIAGGQPCWISVPLIYEHGIQRINDVKINTDQPWQDKLVKTLTINYKKSKHFSEVFETLSRLINYQSNSISEFNIHCILELCNCLEIKCNFILQSKLQTEHSSTELLIEITKKVGANTYLCGGGAGGYQQDELFQVEGLSLEYQDYELPVYPQLGKEFHPGMSIIDVLFNCGINGTRSLIST